MANIGSVANGNLHRPYKRRAQCVQIKFVLPVHVKCTLEAPVLYSMCPAGSFTCSTFVQKSNIK